MLMFSKKKFAISGGIFLSKGEKVRIQGVSPSKGDLGPGIGSEKATSPCCVHKNISWNVFSKGTGFTIGKGSYIT